MKRRQQRWASVATVAAVVLAGGLVAAGGGGCSVKEPITARADPHVKEQIHFADVSLRNRTAVEPPIMERRNGLLYVTVPIRSASNYNLHVDYRVTFFDRSGVPIETTPWLGGKTLTANVPDVIQFNSTNANAADFRLDLREAR